MRQETIQIDKLSIGYTSHRNTKVVASELNATIYSGELTCLLGANGVGKSTLLRTLSGFQPKLGGHIYIQGKDINDYSAKDLSTKVSVVLTERCDVQNMTVAELVGIGRSPYTNFFGSLSDEDKEVVKQSLERVGISKLSERMVQTLSDGERQKVMIAKALAQNTPIIFLDEPTAFLDFPSKVEIMRELAGLCKDLDKTIFLSTHDVELALQLSNRLWLMDKKEGIRCGTHDELAQNGSIEKFFACPGIRFDRQTGLFFING